MIDEVILKDEEAAILKLRSLYRRYGYTPFKMSKFEEYELYIHNKDFLVSDRIITFNDTNGKLMALKPDVTLSIIRNAAEQHGVKQKVFYNENVYRISERTHHFTEIMQTGLECIGDIDFYDIFEVISLAAESLEQISENYVLEISDLGVLSEILNAACTDKGFQSKAISFISQKNSHELQRLCQSFDVSDECTQALNVCIGAYGSRNTVLKKLRGICSSESLRRMEQLSELLDSLPCSDRIRYDFSVVNDMRYYNGFVFRGFVDGLCDGILSGGQYGGMMRKMGKNCGAIGFALYLDQLEQLRNGIQSYDVDVLLIYQDSDAPMEVMEAVRQITAQGLSVSAQKSFPEALRYRELYTLKGGNANA